MELNHDARTPGGMENEAEERSEWKGIYWRISSRCFKIPIWVSIHRSTQFCAQASSVLLRVLDEILEVMHFFQHTSLSWWTTVHIFNLAKPSIPMCKYMPPHSSRNGHLLSSGATYSAGCWTSVPRWPEPCSAPSCRPH